VAVSGFAPLVGIMPRKVNLEEREGSEDMLEPYLAGVVASLLGAIGYIFFWEEYKLKKAIRHLVLAVVAGIIYTGLRQSYGFPDFVVTVVVGWWAPDFIASIATRLKPKPVKERAK